MKLNELSREYGYTQDGANGLSGGSEPSFYSDGLENLADRLDG